MKESSYCESSCISNNEELIFTEVSIYEQELETIKPEELSQIEKALLKSKSFDIGKP